MHRNGIIAKFIISLLFSVNILTAKDLTDLGLVSILSIAAIAMILKSVDWQQLIRLTRSFIYIISFTFSAHYFLQGSNAIESVYYTLRIMALIYGNAVVAASVTIDEFVGGVYRLASWLPLRKVKVDRFIIIVKLSLNFLPILKEEGLNIYRSQKVRGAKFSGVNIVTRVNNYLSLIIPVLVSAIKRADDIALAMKARQFHSYNEQSFFVKQQGYGLTGLAAVFLMAVLTAANLFSFKLYL